MRRAHYQGGSIVSFAVVVIITAGFLIGGAILLRHRSDIAKKEDTPSSENADIAQEGASTDKKDTPSTKRETSSKDESKSEGQNKESDKKSESNPSAASSSETSSADDKDGTSTADLPHSGPAETLITAIGAAGLTYAAIGYYQSRRSIL